MFKIVESLFLNQNKYRRNKTKISKKIIHIIAKNLNFHKKKIKDQKALMKS